MGLGFGETEAEGEGDASPVGAGVGDTSSEGAGVGDSSSEGAGVADSSPVGAGVGDSSPLGTGVGDASSVGEGEGSALFVGAGKGNRVLMEEDATPSSNDVDSVLSEAFATIIIEEMESVKMSTIVIKRIKNALFLFILKPHFYRMIQYIIQNTLFFKPAQLYQNIS